MMEGHIGWKMIARQRGASHGVPESFQGTCMERRTAEVPEAEGHSVDGALQKVHIRMRYVLMETD